MKKVIIIIIIDKNIYEYIYVNFLHNYSTFFNMQSYIFIFSFRNNFKKNIYSIIFTYLLE